MIYHVKEQQISLHGMLTDTITFGKGTKPLVMIQGLNTRGIRGAAGPGPIACLPRIIRSACLAGDRKSSMASR